MESRSPSPPSLSPTPHPNHNILHPPQPQSKRDKRRSALSEKLTGLTNSFHNPTNPRLRDAHYRAQLAGLSADMACIARADVSGANRCLMDDSGDVIHREVDAILSSSGLPRELNVDQGISGKWYSKFLEEVNNVMEERDSQLSTLLATHHTKARGLTFDHTKSLVHAREEHRSLNSTVQLRLMTRLKAQLKKLAAEKEASSQSANALSSLSAGGAFDISEANALLLHPSQFGLVEGIGSPSRHGARDAFGDETEKDTSTRRKPRRRAGEVAELMAFGAGMNFDTATTNGKRKRRGGGAVADTTSTMPEDVPTPPAVQAVDIGSPSGGHSSVDHIANDVMKAEHKKRQEEMLKQVYTPSYALEKLFTEKELQMHGNNAAIATAQYFSDQTYRDHDSNPFDNSHDGNGDGTPAATGANTPLPDGGDADDDDRERGISPMSEITRGLQPLPGVSTRSNPPRAFGRDMESFAAGLGTTYVNKSQLAPTPPPVRPEDVEADLAAMRRSDKRPEVNGGGGGGGKKQRRQ
ncbi:Sds3-like protein [Geopyxis carbonaria]|nr:Sds3-like protein [Geopyxis carbonaria]